MNFLLIQGHTQLLFVSRVFSNHLHILLFVKLCLLRIQIISSGEAEGDSSSCRIGILFLSSKPIRIQYLLSFPYDYFIGAFDFFFVRGGGCCCALGKYPVIVQSPANIG